jgi:hypothetical protein
MMAAALPPKPRIKTALFQVAPNAELRLAALTSP